MSDKHLDDELVARAASGDESAMTELLRLNYDPVYQHVKSMLRHGWNSIDEACDLVQNTMVEVILDIRNYRPTPDSSILAWMKKIAEHQVLDAIKRRNAKKRGAGRRPRRVTDSAKTSSVRRVWEVLSERIETPSHHAIRVDKIEAVNSQVAALPDDQRKAVQLRMQEMSYAEIAGTMDLSEGAVRGLLRRARQTMKVGLRSSSRWFATK
jgi:RNA polymerase sigma factor (sigma-70 family)